MKQSFSLQLIVDEEDMKEVPDALNYYPPYMSYALIKDIFEKAGYQTELVQSPGCKGGAVVVYLKRKQDAKSD